MRLCLLFMLALCLKVSAQDCNKYKYTGLKERTDGVVTKIIYTEKPNATSYSTAYVGYGFRYTSGYVYLRKYGTTKMEPVKFRVDGKDYQIEASTQGWDQTNSGHSVNCVEYLLSDEVLKRIGKGSYESFNGVANLKGFSKKIVAQYACVQSVYKGRNEAEIYAPVVRKDTDVKHPNRVYYVSRFWSVGDYIVSIGYYKDGDSTSTLLLGSGSCRLSGSGTLSHKSESYSLKYEALSVNDDMFKNCLCDGKIGRMPRVTTYSMDDEDLVLVEAMFNMEDVFYRDRYRKDIPLSEDWKKSVNSVIKKWREDKGKLNVSWNTSYELKKKKEAEQAAIRAAEREEERKRERASRDSVRSANITADSLAFVNGECKFSIDETDEFTGDFKRITEKKVVGKGESGYRKLYAQVGRIKNTYALYLWSSSDLGCVSSDGYVILKSDDGKTLKLKNLADVDCGDRPRFIAMLTESDRALLKSMNVTRIRYSLSEHYMDLDCVLPTYFKKELVCLTK